MLLGETLQGPQIIGMALVLVGLLGFVVLNQRNDPRHAPSMDRGNALQRADGC